MLLKFDVNLQKIFTVSQFSKYDVQMTPKFQNMTDNSVFPFSSQLKRLPDLKKTFCRLY